MSGTNVAESANAGALADAKILRPVPRRDQPIQFDFLDRANEFMAYRVLTGVRHPNSPRNFLLCHAIELALKAFLLHKGISEKDIIAFEVRHNLAELLGMALEKGLELRPNIAPQIVLLAEAHRKHRPRYPDKGEAARFLIDEFEPDAAHLVAAVSAALAGAQRRDG